MKKPKIVFTLFDFYIGGIESFLYNLANKLNTKYEFFFLATHVPKFQAKFYDVGNPIFIPFNNPEEIIDFFKRINPDIVQIHNDDLPLKCALAAGVSNLIERTDGTRSCTRLPKDNFRYVIASSNGTIEMISKYISKENIRLIYNGIDLNYVAALERTRLFDKDCFVVGRSCRFGRGKNLQLLINAIKILSIKYENIRLVLIGGNSEMPGAEDMEAELKVMSSGFEKYIHFLGNMEEPQQTIKGFDVVTCVSNSLNEGIPNSLMEGMATGIPAIATDVDQINELVINNDNGFLIEENNLEQLINALEKYLLDPMLREHHGRNAYKTIKEQFNMKDSALAYDKLYQEIFNS
jgi:glycosyltransferase involved in cell wall biosynthesis